MSLAKREPVDIWRVNLHEARGLLLSEDEKQRAARFHFEQDRLHWSRARSALRQVLAKYTGTAPLDLAFLIGEHGKPALPDSTIQFNLSHSGEWALIAISRSAPVGVDIERIRDNVDIAKLLRRIGEDPGDRNLHDLFQMWTIREARTKAAGEPLMMVLRPDVTAIPIDAPDGYVAAVAMLGCEPDPLAR